MSSVELATAAAQAALSDTGVDMAAVARVIDTVAGIRQFEISGRTPAPLGKSNNYPRSVAQRIGADPARAIVEPIGGQGPQHLVTEFAGAIAAGSCGVVMLFGSENTSSLRFFEGRAEQPDHSETVEGSLEDRGYGYDGIFDEYTSRTDCSAPQCNTDCWRTLDGPGWASTSRTTGSAWGELFAPFTKVAAKNPFSSSPVERTVDELTTVTEANRMICDPYPRLLLARDQVNQGAAVLLMSVAAARRLGVPQEKWVYLRGHADLVEQKLLGRVDVSTSPASIMAVREALSVAGTGLDDVATFDLYSCFPIPVFTVCDGMGLATDDARGLTLTGGLPFFGGPGNNYSMHGIAETVSEMRERPGQFGLVGANGGIMSKYSVGVCSTEPAEWVPDNSVALCDEVKRLPEVPVTIKADGPATIETYSVRYDWPIRTGIIMGRLDDNSRFLATSEDENLVALLSDGEPLGASIVVRATEAGNRGTWPRNCTGAVVSARSRP